MLFIVGADIQDDRQRCRGMQTGTGGVQRQFSDWDPHSPGALITKAENALAVTYDDDLNVIVPRMTDDAAYVVLVRNAQK